MDHPHRTTPKSRGADAPIQNLKSLKLAIAQIRLASGHGASVSFSVARLPVLLHDLRVHSFVFQIAVKPLARIEDDLSKYNILQKAGPEDVVWQPYPYLVLRNALPTDLYNELSEAYLSAQELVDIARGRQSAVRRSASRCLQADWLFDRST
eukprot:1283328-Pyramimonas_sp.AAC.1